MVTISTRVTAAGRTGATAGMAAVGGILIVVGAAAHQPAGIALGACLSAVGCARVWLRDRSSDRARLLDAIQDCEAERARYMAARIAVDAERSRLLRDREDAARRAADELARRRAELEAEFEEAHSSRALAIWREAARQIVIEGLLDEPSTQEAVVVPMNLGTGAGGQVAAKPGWP